MYMDIVPSSEGASFSLWTLGGSSYLRAALQLKRGLLKNN